MPTNSQQSSGIWKTIIAGLGIATWCLVAVPQVKAQSSFIHVATAGNTVSEFTCVDDPRINGRPEAILFAIQNLTPGGGSATVNDAPIGWFYSGFDGQHCIRNQDSSAMPLGAAFNVLVFEQPAGLLLTAYRHVTSMANTPSGDVTLLTHPELDGITDRVLLVQHVGNPDGEPSVLSLPANLGLRYEEATAARGVGSWAVFTQDGSTLPSDRTFNVFVLDLFAAVEARYAVRTSGTSAFQQLFSGTFDLPIRANDRVFAIASFGHPQSPAVPGAVNDHVLAVSVSFSDFGDSWRAQTIGGDGWAPGVGFHAYFAPLFYNGFESGGTTIWTASQP